MSIYSLDVLFPIWNQSVVSCPVLLLPDLHTQHISGTQDEIEISDLFPTAFPCQISSLRYNTFFFFIFPSWLTNNNLFSHNSEKFKIMVPVDSSPSLITIFSLQPHLAGDWVISIIQKPSMAHLTGVIRSSLILPPHYLCTLCPLFSLLIFLNSISSFAPTRIPPLQEAFPGVFSS